jgi:hypothetical protein
MDEIYRTKDQKKKTFLASLNLKANEYRQTLEERLAVRN